MGAGDWQLIYTPRDGELGDFDPQAATALASRWGDVTSTARTPEHNRKVGGVPNSWHLDTRGARAIDIARAPGVTHRQIADDFRANGYDLMEDLDEGDHSHIAIRSGPVAPPERDPAPGGWELVSTPEASPRPTPSLPPIAASFAPVPAQAPLLSSAPQLTQADRTRGRAVEPVEPAQAQEPWAQGYKSDVDPEKVKQLRAALNAGASVEELLTLAGQLGVQLDGGADAVRELVKYRDSGREGAGFYAKQVGVPKKEEPIITARDWGDLSIPQKAGDIMGNLARAIGHPYANRIERETATAADWLPFIGGAASIERGGEEFKRGEYGSAALSAGLGTIDFIPAVGPLARMIGKGGTHVVDATLLRSIASDADGAVDMARAGNELREASDQALARGGKVTLHVEGRAIPITKPGLVDEAGQSWGAMPILSPKPGDHARLEIDMPAARTVDRLDVSGAPQAPARVVDRIDVGLPKGWEIEPPTGPTRVMGEMPTSPQLDEAVRRIRPEDVTPLPRNYVDGLDEFERIGDPRPLLTPPNPADELAMRKIAGRNRRGPLDLAMFARSQGGIKDAGGELAHYGITNAARRGVEFAGGENFLGALVNNVNGRSLDDAALAAWEAGYFPHHTSPPPIADYLEALSGTHRGTNRVFRPEDLDEVARYDAAVADRNMIEAAAQEGKPLAGDVGQPIGLDDLSANEPPAHAYEDLPALAGRVGNINLQKLGNAGDIARALQRMEREFAFGHSQRRSHAEVAALAREMGVSLSELLAANKSLDKLDVRATAGRVALSKAYREMIEIGQRAKQTGTDADMVAFQKAVRTVAAIHHSVANNQREIARALGSFRQVVDPNMIPGKALRHLIEENGGDRATGKLLDKILDMHQSGVGQGGVVQFAVKASKPGMLDKVLELYRSSMLSGLRTHTTNITGNLLATTLSVPEFAVASAIGSLRLKSADRIHAQEIVAYAGGMKKGLRDGLRAFKETLITGETSDFANKLDVRHSEAIPGRTGHVIRTTFRLLSATDEVFKSIARQATLSRLAIKEATRAGLKGDALAERADQLLELPTPDMMKQANDFARYMTFQNEPGPITQFGMDALRKLPALGFFIPWVRTPGNLLRFAAERSPVGLIMPSVWRELRAGGEQRDLAIARMVVGSAIGLTAYEAAQNGYITGGGPLNRGTQDLLKQQGWQPYSIWIGDRYISYRRLDPVATVVGLAADLATYDQYMTQRERERGASLLTQLVSRNLRDSYWLGNAAEFLEVLADPFKKGPGKIADIAGTLAVPNLIAQPTASFDPLERDQRPDPEGNLGQRILEGMLNRVKGRIPGLRETLPARTDPWGEPVPNDAQWGPDIISPFQQRLPRPDPVAGAMVENDLRVGSAFSSIDNEPVPPKMRRDLNKLASRYIRDDMREAVASDEWKALSPAERRDRFEQIKRDAREDAKADLWLNSAQPESDWKLVTDASAPAANGWERIK